jgi:hypothetical protein
LAGAGVIATLLIASLSRRRNARQASHWHGVGAIDPMPGLGLADERSANRPQKRASTAADLEVWYPPVVPMESFKGLNDEPTKEKPRRNGASMDGSDGTRTRDLRRDRPAL